MNDANALTAISPLDGRYGKKVSGLRPVFSEFGLQSYRIQVERKWYYFLIQNLVDLSGLDRNEIFSALESCNQGTLEEISIVKEYEAQCNHDVKAIEYLIREQLSAAGFNKYIEFIHFGLTSEDVTNLAIALMTSDGLDLIMSGIMNLVNELRVLADTYREVPMMSHTHGQPASPTTVGKEFMNFAWWLNNERIRLDDIEIMGKLNGASGNYNALYVSYPEIDWINLSQKFVNHEIGIGWNCYTVQTNNYQYLAEILQCLIRIACILTKLDRDMWEYISRNYFGQKAKKGEVGSSTMPHKVNPIDFENSEGNLQVMVIPISEAMTRKLLTTRLQRDLSDSTSLRNLGNIFGHLLLALESTRKGLGKITVNKQAISSDLNKHPELLSEAAQHLLRKEGIDGYQIMKELTRGQKKITKAQIIKAAKEAGLSGKGLKILESLTPAKYTGYGKDLARWHWR